MAPASAILNAISGWPPLNLSASTGNMASGRPQVCPVARNGRKFIVTIIVGSWLMWGPKFRGTNINQLAGGFLISYDPTYVMTQLTSTYCISSMGRQVFFVEISLGKR